MLCGQSPKGREQCTYLDQLKTNTHLSFITIKKEITRNKEQQISMLLLENSVSDESFNGRSDRDEPPNPLN